METTEKGFFRKSWDGEERLWKVWWLWGLPLGIVSAVVSVLIEDYADSSNNVTTSIISLLIYIFVIVLYLWWVGAAWRCVKNTNNKAWTLIAQFLIIVGLLRFAIEFISAFQKSF
tara:strand:+ start:135 stop:479 length:345 start_codon:yes stop_codon:yes gene_type:complete